MKTRIPVIDLFAGPGGLSEGMSSVRHDGKPVFKIALSIEKDLFAHRTLELRAFFRQFSNHVPGEYYDYITGNLTRDELFTRFPNAGNAAREDAWLAELGKVPNRNVDRKIQRALGARKTWILIGGPPCQAYSLVGRSRIRGESVEKYEKDHRHFLYRQYLRILAEHAPPVFVMENVKGLLSATVKNQRIFKRIRNDLSSPREAIRTTVPRKQLKYRLFSLVTPNKNVFGEFDPEDFVVRAERYGVPQARHRVIILGIRSDISTPPSLLIPSDSPSVYETIRDLPKLRSGLSKQFDSTEEWRSAVREVLEENWFLNGEITRGMRQSVRAAAHRLNTQLTRGSEFVPNNRRPTSLTNWFFDPRLEGALNHATRAHIVKDLHRYLFASVFAEEKGRTPLLQDFPKALLPKHKNVNEALKHTKFNDRFRVQVADRPSTTITSHISKDGHYFIHYDPQQCRSLTVREAARLQTFPDNYFFEGPRTEQYKQVGNAVPPFLAKQIAEIVAKLLK